MQFSSALCCFLFLKSEYSHHHFVLNSNSFRMRDHISHPYQDIIDVQRKNETDILNARRVTKHAVVLQFNYCPEETPFRQVLCSQSYILHIKYFRPVFSVSPFPSLV
jgi:hypothetical protein